jgi:hypothetical protein
MIETFINSSHLILMAYPSSSKTKQFLLNETDILGYLHYNWLDVPEEALVKVSRQILNFEV